MPNPETAQDIAQKLTKYIDSLIDNSFLGREACAPLQEALQDMRNVEDCLCGYAKTVRIYEESGLIITDQIEYGLLQEPFMKAGE